MILSPSLLSALMVPPIISTYFQGIERTFTGIFPYGEKYRACSDVFRHGIKEQSADRDDLLSDRMCRTFAVSGSTVRNGRADRGIAGIFLVPPFIL